MIIYRFANFGTVRWMLNLLIALLLPFTNLVCGNKYNSPQSPDALIYNGDTFNIYNLIIDDVVREIRHDQGKLFSLSFRDGATFNCWRGYQAIYVVEADKVLLESVVACGTVKKYFRGDTTVILNDLLDDIIKYQGGSWIKSANTSVTIANNANLVRWDGVFDRVFEAETKLRIKGGRIINSTNITNYVNDPDRLDRKYGDTVHQILYEEIVNLDWAELNKYECADGDTYKVLIDSRGRVKDVSFLDYEAHELDEYWDDKAYKHCFTNLKDALSRLKFDEVYWHGETFQDQIYLTLWYENGKLENWSD